MNIDWGVIKQHEQRYHTTCIPSAVEMILKVLGKVDINYYEQQEAWKDKTTRNFRPFDGKTIEGVAFKIEFDDKEYPRGSDFPIEKLFQFIDKELEVGRYVIISLPSLLVSNLGFIFGSFHMWVIYAKNGDDYLAFSKVALSETDQIAKATVILDRVKHLVRMIQGTDILTYRMIA